MSHDDHQANAADFSATRRELGSEAPSAPVELDSLGYEGAFPYLSALQAELETC